MSSRYFLNLAVCALGYVDLDWLIWLEGTLEGWAQEDLRQVVQPSSTPIQYIINELV